MNGARGEVEIEIAGASRTLCLTLGALAEMEALFGCETLSDLQVRLKRLSAAELIDVLRILLRAAGDDCDVAGVLPARAAAAVAEAFHAALG